MSCFKSFWLYAGVAENPRGSQRVGLCDRDLTCGKDGADGASHIMWQAGGWEVGCCGLNFLMCREEAGGRHTRPCQ